MCKMVGLISIFHSWRIRVYWVLLVLYYTGKVQLLGSPVSITALSGDDVILPCSLKPPVSPDTLILEWVRPDLSPKDIHIYRDGKDLPDQNPSYKHRTALFKEELKNGNVSLKLSRVRLEDEGNYTCLIMLSQETVIQLIVGKGPLCQPVISILGFGSGEVVLQCESKSWYPEPQLEWLDSDRHVLSAEAIDLAYDTDGHHIVRSNITVKKSDTNKFTCKVQLEKISHATETEIHLPGDIFKTVPCDHGGVIIFLAVFCTAMVALMAVLTYSCMKHKRGAHGTTPDPESDLKEKENTTQSQLKLTALEKEKGGLSTSSGGLESLKQRNSSQNLEEKEKLIENEKGGSNLRRAQSYPRYKDL